MFFKPELVNKDKFIFFNSLLKVYQFKSFKKNLRFKRLGKGVTKFLKTRKKYFFKKRQTSNIFDYIYMYTWGKSYMLSRQFVRYSQLLQISSIGFNSIKFLCDLRTKVLLSDSLKIIFFNFSTMSKKLFFNNTYFFKKNYLALHKFSFNTFLSSFNVSTSVTGKTNVIDKIDYELVFTNNVLVRSSNCISMSVSNNMGHLMFFRSIVNSLLFKSLIFLVQFRRLFVLFILWKI